ncbi:hypothetical protein CDAR_243991 [Caerostris darwini]|uniref:Uncharacterized protein n=1 Tax=Caerostris darwini TaxID=1538125 RepID=A0AAV4RTP5_9ARAC|nr:hypothetical protein CDAR_243991 [Caerostris darwini]
MEFDIAQSVFSVRQEQRERIPPSLSLSNRTIPSPAITERPQMGWGEWRAGSLRMARMFCLPCRGKNNWWVSESVVVFGGCFKWHSDIL